MTRYYGVVSNRDYITINGQKRPFWEFLDHEPEGWLCSLAYVRHDPPHHRPCLWDCGAWSYRDKEVPKIKGNRVTATWAFEQYSALAQRGDLVVAPDHMLIPDTDHAARRLFNQESAAQFLQHTQGSGLIPMACVHGTSIDERIAHANELCAMGYKHLALGGLAGRASQKRIVLEIVEHIRVAIPHGIWLHVLGLSAPFYYKEWLRIGINSCDGASQFKQAFSGTFYMVSDADPARLQAHKAVKQHEQPTAPLCECTACATLRGHNIDTRTYGSNQHNMGRAAHNLTMLMRAHHASLQEHTQTPQITQERMDFAPAPTPLAMAQP